MLQIANLNESKVEAQRLNYAANLKPLVSKSPLLSCEVCVIVPVCNEAENLEATLQALANQTDLGGKPFDKNRYEIIVLANNCSDNSEKIAISFAKRHPKLILHVVEITLSPERAYIGWVRKILMDEAYRRLTILGRDRALIASTDGDTRVSPTWIAALLEEIKNGADAVGGRTITDRSERVALDKTTRLYFLRYVSYRYLVAQLEALIDPNPFDFFPRHHQHFGANLAVTAQMYARVGGLPPVRTPEDVALYEALMRVDARFRHSPNVRVVTSARVIGRAGAGLSKRLTQLTEMGQKHESIFVESALLVENRFRVRRQLRYLWEAKENGEKLPGDYCAIAARKLGITTDLLFDTILLSPTFGLLVEKIGQYQLSDEELYARHWQKVEIQKAISDLRARVIRNFELDSLEEIEPILLLPQSF